MANLEQKKVISKVMTISTGHLCPVEHTKMCQAPDLVPVSYCPAGILLGAEGADKVMENHGWLIHMPDETDLNNVLNELQRTGMHSLCYIIAMAKAHGAALILLDGDAERLPGLPWYSKDWNKMDKRKDDIENA